MSLWNGDILTISRKYTSRGRAIENVEKIADFRGYK